MIPKEIEEAARRLARNRTDRAALHELPTSCRPADEDAAYAVQDAMNVLLATGSLGDIAGWKIGCTTPVMQSYMGIDHPGAGAMLSSTVHTTPASLRHADYVAIGVEGEIAVRLSADLPAAHAPFDRDSVADAVGACMTAVELVDARYADYRSLDTWTMVADNFFNAGCVLAPPVADWRALDLPSAAGAMTVNGAETGRGVGGNVMGHPFESLAWLANTLARPGRSLAAGEVVLTGSIVETQWLAAGDSMRFAVEGLGEVAASFT
jgi:2-oxo-3-hexenedioate decarboxylase/2-keto-4-pentenoate hydratase